LPRLGSRHYFDGCFPICSVYQGKAVDGIKITQMLKANAQTAKLPIILVTAHAMEGDRENFLSRVVLMATFLKPVVDHHQFVAQILALLPKTSNDSISTT